MAGAVNLYSDTQTRPSEGMRRAIATADVGDEQRREDPTTLRLEERVAELLGQEAGPVPAERHDVQPDRAAPARAARAATS